MATLAPIECDTATRPPMRNFHAQHHGFVDSNPQGRHPLDVSTPRKSENDSNYYTLLILVNPSTNAKLGGSFGIANYLQESYPAAGAGDLFPPRELDFMLNKDQAFLESPF
ncbi:hypothetical protein N7488_009477 [Penicillium malachiteum]|nr:hypothetical protein N7488_009477 [Penicillium malachiteum]